MPDATLEAIVEVARKRWPLTRSVTIYRGDVEWHDGHWDEEECSIMVWIVPKRGTRLRLACDESAPTLPALLAKLKGEEDAT